MWRPLKQLEHVLFRVDFVANRENQDRTRQIRNSTPQRSSSWITRAGWTTTDFLSDDMTTLTGRCSTTTSRCNWQILGLLDPEVGVRVRKYQHSRASVVSKALPGVRRVNDSKMGATSSRHVRSTALRGGSQSELTSSSSSFSGDSTSSDVSDGMAQHRRR